MKRISALCGVFFMFCGCATTANYRNAVNSWVGADAETLVRTWGYPAKTFEAPNGNTVYEYSSSESYRTSRFTSYHYDPKTGYGYATTYGGDTLNLYCITYFEVNKEKKVARASFKGNSCKASAPEEAREKRK